MFNFGRNKSKEDIKKKKLPGEEENLVSSMLAYYYKKLKWSPCPLFNLDF